MSEINTNNSLWSLLNELSKKKGISEVIINDIDNVYIERAGELIRLNVELKRDDFLPFCKDVAKLNKANFGPNFPIIDGSLPDGSRINVIAGAYTQGVPAITIRKYLRHIRTFDELNGEFGLTKKWITFLKALVHSKKNVMVAGGTGNGKTTFLNLLLQDIHPTERVITIEDTRELYFNLPNSVNLLSQANNSNIDSPLAIRDLLKNTLRMRPDRVIIGEVRGGEAFDLLQAMNTGHDGSMCTVHANSPSEALNRLENLFLFSGFNVPVKAVRQQICSALDFVIQLERNRDGKRIVSRISEVTNMEGETILLQDIANSSGEGPAFTGLVPQCLASLLDHGLTADFFMDI